MKPIRIPDAAIRDFNRREREYWAGKRPAERDDLPADLAVFLKGV